MDAFATAVGEGRREAAQRDAAWRAARDRLETSLVHAATPAPDSAVSVDSAPGGVSSPGETDNVVGVGSASSRPLAAPTYSQNLMAALVQRATAPVDAIHECVRSAALSARIKLSGPSRPRDKNDPPAGAVPSDSSVAAFAWPGLTYAFGFPKPRKPQGYPASAADVPIAGWLWRLDPSRWQKAWQRQWLFVASGRLYCVTESSSAGQATESGPASGGGGQSTPNDAGGAAATKSGAAGGGGGAGSRVMGSVAGAAIAFASAAYASAAAGFEDRHDAAPLLNVRAVCDLATANIRFAALPPVEAQLVPPPVAANGSASDRPPPAAKRSLLSRAVAAASNYIRGPGDDVGTGRMRRTSGTPAGPMGGGYPIPFALLQDDSQGGTGSDADVGDATADGDGLIALIGVDDIAGPSGGGVEVHALQVTPRSHQPADPIATPTLSAPYAVLNAFEIRAPHETFVFAALTSTQRRVWVDTLKRLSENEITFGHNPVTSSALHSSGASKQPQIVVTAAEVEAIASRLESCAPDLVSTPPKEPSAFLSGGSVAAAVQAIIASNATCSDCDSPSPQWVSLNLGCVFCLSCSGVHRSLGAHVSRVRSLTLDSVDVFALAALLRMGNNVCNSIYEDAELMRAQGFLKPGPTASRAERDAFIRAKYERRAFVNRSGFPAVCAVAASARMLAAVEAAADAGGTSDAATLVLASAEGCLPVLLWCLARGASVTVADRVAPSPLHVAAAGRRWAALYELVSFSGWSPPGEPDSSGRTVWQTALAALAPIGGATDPGESGPVARSPVPVAAVEPLLAALATLLVRPSERPLALAEAARALSGNSGLDGGGAK
jgi:hypothetical protein